MAELAITALTLTGSSPSKPSKVQVGEAVAEGDFGYKSGTKYYLCDNSTAVKAACTVMFLKAAALDGYTYILETGSTIDIGISTTAGEAYVIASTAGQCELLSDLASTEFITQVFYGSGSSVITFLPESTGYQHA